MNTTETGFFKKKNKRSGKKKKLFFYNDKEIYTANNLNDLKKLIKTYLDRGLPVSAVTGIINKWKRRETRRLKRQQERSSSKVCYGCRQIGHELSDCPEATTSTSSSSVCTTGICFKCGSTEHTVRQCNRKNIKGFPFAKCFICEQQGHLAKDCERNLNGIYPDGGTCKLCGMRSHLVKDCPQLLSKEGIHGSVNVVRASADKHRSVDEEDNVMLDTDIKKPKKKAKKVIKF